MDRCALFVDAGYVLADGAMAVHGTQRRESVSWDYGGLLQLLGNLAMGQSGLPLLRCYWYERAADGRRNAEQDALADMPGVKLRLAKTDSGYDGVTGIMHRDLTALARNQAVSDAMVVSSAEELTQVVGDVQDLGMRVTLLHIAADGNWTISRTLRQECDDIVEISPAHLRPYVELISGAEPPRADERPGGATLALRPQSNGHVPGTRTTGYAPLPPAGSSNGQGNQALPALYMNPVVSDLQRPVPRVAPQIPGEQAPPAAPAAPLSPLASLPPAPAASAGSPAPAVASPLRPAEAAGPAPETLAPTAQPPAQESPAPAQASAPATGGQSLPEDRSAQPQAGQPAQPLLAQSQPAPSQPAPSQPAPRPVQAPPVQADLGAPPASQPASASGGDLLAGLASMPVKRPGAAVSPEGASQEPVSVQDEPHHEGPPSGSSRHAAAQQRRELPVSQDVPDRRDLHGSPDGLRGPLMPQDADTPPAEQPSPPPVRNDARAGRELSSRGSTAARGEAPSRREFTAYQDLFAAPVSEVPPAAAPVEAPAPTPVEVPPSPQADRQAVPLADRGRPADPSGYDPGASREPLPPQTDTGAHHMPGPYQGQAPPRPARDPGYAPGQPVQPGGQPLQPGDGQAHPAPSRNGSYSGPQPAISIRPGTSPSPVLDTSGVGQPAVAPAPVPTGPPQPAHSPVGPPAPGPVPAAPAPAGPPAAAPGQPMEGQPAPWQTDPGQAAGPAQPVISAQPVPPQPVSPQPVSPQPVSPQPVSPQPVSPRPGPAHAAPGPAEPGLPPYGGQPAYGQPDYPQQGGYAQPDYPQPEFGQPGFAPGTPENQPGPGAGGFPAGPAEGDPLAMSDPGFPGTQPNPGAPMGPGSPMNQPAPANGAPAAPGAHYANHGAPASPGMPPAGPGAPGGVGMPPVNAVNPDAALQDMPAFAPAAPQPSISLADAVQSAHEEGQEFGGSVARDAPTLWLEAVLARKPRMPSDLEARLLQGSSLPIDFLLHDEVRHALRRGFWDALERARR